MRAIAASYSFSVLMRAITYRILQKYYFSSEFSNILRIFVTILRILCPKMSNDDDYLERKAQKRWPALLLTTERYNLYVVGLFSVPLEVAEVVRSGEVNAFLVITIGFKWATSCDDVATFDANHLEHRTIVFLHNHNHFNS